MKAKYIGDPTDDFSGPRVARMGYGKGADITVVSFPRDQFVNLPQQLEEKLKANREFVVEEGDAPAYAGPEPEVRAKPTATKAVGGASKAEVLAKLESLAAEHADVIFDPKWGLPKLRGVLEEAEFAYGDED